MDEGFKQQLVYLPAGITAMRLDPMDAPDVDFCDVS
jgi:hypothetical protein